MYVRGVWTRFPGKGPTRDWLPFSIEHILQVEAFRSTDTDIVLLCFAKWRHKEAYNVWTDGKMSKEIPTRMSSFGAGTLWDSATWVLCLKWWGWTRWFPWVLPIFNILLWYFPTSKIRSQSELSSFVFAQGLLCKRSYPMCLRPTATKVNFHFCKILILE